MTSWAGGGGRGVVALSAEPPAVKKDFCPSTLCLVPRPSSCDNFKTNCENGMLEIQFGIGVDKFMVLFW